MLQQRLSPAQFSQSEKGFRSPSVVRQLADEGGEGTKISPLARP
ncbi:MAG: hypothetical protein AAB503_01140 [Patescibacteria group bacterium]